jgi:hypothetical protein
MMKNAVFWHVTPCGSCKNLRFRGTSALTRATWCNIPEDGILHSHHYENLKSYLSQDVFYASQDLPRTAKIQIRSIDALAILLHSEVVNCFIDHNLNEGHKFLHGT